MGIRVEGRVFDKISNNGIEGIKIILISEDKEKLLRTETNQEGFYTFLDIDKEGIYRVIECGSENFDLENLEVKNFKNSTSKKYYEFEIIKSDLIYEKNKVNLDFSHDNEKTFFEVKNHERVFISPIGDVFLINTFNGEVSFKLNTNIEFSNLNYNQLDKQYYFINIDKYIEIFRISEQNKVINIGKIEDLDCKHIENLISDISVDGILYFMNTTASEIYSISLNQNRMDFARKYEEIEGEIKLKEEVYFSAFTHNIIDGNIYGIDKNTNLIKRVDISSGEVIELNSSYSLSNCEISIMFSDNLGYIYVIDDLTGNAYRISISLNGTIINLLSKGISDKKDLGGELINNSANNEEKIIDVEKTIDDKVIKKGYNIQNGITTGRLYKDICIKDIDIIKTTKNGVLNINKTNGYWTYIPDDEFGVVDSFSVLITKDDEQKEEINIEINQEDSLEEVSISSILENDTKVYSLLNNTIINDKINNYKEGEFNYSINKGGKKGIAQINKDTGEWTYEPYYGAGGEDKFDILISNRTGGYRIETISLEILNPKLYIEQIADKESISFDDFIEYKIFVRNIGNIKAENVIIREFLDSALSFEKNSLKISGIEQDVRNLNFVEIGTIDIGESIEISFKGYLNDIIEQKDIIQSKANIRCEFKISDYQETQTLAFDSNLVRTDIVYGNISYEDIIFTANKSVTTVDDMINFKLSFKNNGNIEIDKLVVKNLVSNGSIFENNNVFIDGQEFNFDIETYGIILNDIAVNQKVVLEYQLKVQGNNAILEFSPILEYQYLVDYRKKTRSLTLDTLKINNIIPKIDIKKYCDTEKAIIGDVVRSNIILENIGNINIENIALKEILDEGIVYDGNLVINGEESNQILTEGVEIQELIVGKPIRISYDSIIDMCPINDFLSFITDISYNYRAMSEFIEGNNLQEELKLKILKYDLNLEIKFSKDKVLVGDEFYLGICLINIGETKLENIVMSYPLLEEVEILEVQVDEKEYTEDINSQININFIKNRERKEIKFKLKAVKNIDESKIKYIEIEADIKKDLDKVSRISRRTKIDNAIEIFEPKLTIEKFLNKECVVVGEEVEMCIILENRGNITLEDIVLTDLLSDELEFIEGTISINNKVYDKESIISGINILKISPSETLDIRCKFKVIKEANKKPDIMLKAFAIYNYTLDKEVFCNNIESNICILNISKIELEIQKISDKEFVKLGDEITYEVTIVNTGSKDALNILFIDELFEGLELVNRSFSIEGEFINNVNVKKGIIIGDIKVAGIKKISYKVKIVKTSSKLDINTRTYVNYSYILSDGSNGRTKSEVRRKNVKSVDIALSNFRQVDKDEYLKIPSEKPDIQEIDGVSASVEIFNTQIIKTPIVNSTEGQILTGYKLLITGYIHETIEYTSNNDYQVMYSTSYQLPFSDYIILPVDFNINSRVEVEGKVENVYYKKINKREFFNNATLLLVAKILST